MNKTVIINIAGSIFHIEEDAYNLIKSYDAEIRKHFTDSPDGFEIVSDIENRIAELLLEKLDKESRQVVILQDVDEVVKRLGKVSDYDTEYQENAGEENEYHFVNEQPIKRKLMRNPGNKRFAGVCSGLSAYFNVDVTFTRLIWVVLVLMYGIGAFAYVVLWFVMPKPKTQDDFDMLMRPTTNNKKLYRNTQDKMLGGVCSGIAAYINADVAWVRLAFVVLLFPSAFFLFRNGFVWPSFSMMLIYIVLWLIVPEAKTLGEKMAMKGEPDNLSSIVKHVEQAKHAENETRNALSEIFGFFAQIIKFFGSSFVKLCGVILILVAISFAVTIIITTIIGLKNEGPFHELQFIPVADTILFSVSALFATIILAFWVLWLGLRMIVKVNVINKTVALSLWGIWLLSVVCCSYIIVNNLLNFKESAAEQEILTMVKPNSKTYILNVNREDVYDENGEIAQPSNKMNKIYTLSSRTKQNKISLQVEKSPDNEAHLIKKTSAKGKNIKDAIKNIQTTEYKIIQTDSVLVFNRSFKLTDDKLWRDQGVRIILQLPVGTTIISDSRINDICWQLEYWNCRLNENSETAAWQMTENGLKCLKPEVKNEE